MQTEVFDFLFKKWHVKAEHFEDTYRIVLVHFKNEIFYSIGGYTRNTLGAGPGSGNSLGLLKLIDDHGP